MILNAYWEPLDFELPRWIAQAKRHGAAGSTQPSTPHTTSSNGKQQSRFPAMPIVSRRALWSCSLREFDLKRAKTDNRRGARVSGWCEISACVGYEACSPVFIWLVFGENASFSGARCHAKQFFDSKFRESTHVRHICKINI